jgi:hypothetical protein
MPGLGSPFVREMRRIAAAHAAFPGSPPRDPAELLSWYDERGRVAEDDSITSISRRDFLRRTAVVGAGVAGATMLGWGRARLANAADANVVIVGAGLGGLSCAYRLMRHGIPSTVYESRDRVGGPVLDDPRVRERADRRARRSVHRQPPPPDPQPRQGASRPAGGHRGAVLPRRFRRLLLVRRSVPHPRRDLRGLPAGPGPPQEGLPARGQVLLQPGEARRRSPSTT